jgi:uncharacterized membrane protein YraQ (UPF0718 family)
MDFLLKLLGGGAVSVLTYFAAHILVCLIPAFFIAGAIETFFSPSRILRWFSRGSTKPFFYALAALSGFALITSPDDILPYFGAIYRRKPGTGPAFTFFYSGPAINIIAVALTFRVLGWQLGAGRILAAVGFSFVIGISMGLLWGRKEPPLLPKSPEFTIGKEYPDRLPGGKTAVFFTLLLGVLVFAVAQSELRRLIPSTGILGELLSWLPAVFSLLGVIVVVDLWFTRRDFMRWLKATWRVARQVVPKLAIGVFIIGVFQTLVPYTWIARAAGGNSILSNISSSVFGSIMYFATATEVPLTNTLVNMGMGLGPALALLLAGPALSIFHTIKLARHLGWGCTLTYVGLVIATATASGLIFGALAAPATLFF